MGFLVQCNSPGYGKKLERAFSFFHEHILLVKRTIAQLFRSNKNLFSDPDFPEQECPKDSHHQGKTPDNRTADPGQVSLLP